MQKMLYRHLFAAHNKDLRLKDHPQELSDTIVASTKLFEVHAVELLFSNGEHRTFERLESKVNSGIVILIAINDKDELLLVREYGAAVKRYILGLPRGGINKGDNALETAQRELAEELKIGAHTWTLLRELRHAPGYSGVPVHTFLATDLYPYALQGDEPEALEIVPWPLSKIDELIDTLEDLHSVLALLILKQTREKL